MADQRPPFACVLLDVGGTLWPERGLANQTAVRTARLRSALPGLTGSQASVLLEQFSRRAAVAEQGLAQDLARVLEQAGRAAGLELAPAQVEAVRRGMCVPAVGALTLFPGAETLLRTIRHLGLGCALVSNASVRTGADYRQDFADFGLADLIDVSVSSVDVGIRKPDARLFEAALHALGCSAARAVVVGNSEPNDIEPARRLGARTIRVAIEQPKPSTSVADAVATALADVAGILSRLGGGRATVSLGN